MCFQLFLTRNSKLPKDLVLKDAMLQFQVYLRDFILVLIKIKSKKIKKKYKDWVIWLSLLLKIKWLTLF